MSRIVNPLQISRFIDVTDDFQEGLTWKYGAFTRTGLFNAEGITTTHLIAKVDQQGRGKMTGFTSRQERDADRVARRTGKNVAMQTPHIKIVDAVTYEDLENHVVYSNMQPKLLEEEVTEATIKRMEEMSDSMQQNLEYLAVTACQGRMRDPYDGSVYADYFEMFGKTQTTVTLDLTDPSLDIISWSRNFVKTPLTKANTLSPSIPTIDIFVTNEDLAEIEKHPSLTALRASLAIGQGLAGLNTLGSLSSKIEWDAHGITSVLDLGNGVRFVTYPQNFYNMAGEVVDIVEEGEGFTVLRGVKGLYQARFAPAPYFPYLNSKGTETLALMTPVKLDQEVELVLESSPLYYITNPELCYKVVIKK